MIVPCMLCALVVCIVQFVPSSSYLQATNISRPHLKWSPKYMQEVRSKYTLRDWRDVDVRNSSYRRHFTTALRRRPLRVHPPPRLHERTLRAAPAIAAPDACAENLCQHGALCVKAQCLCLPHFTGRYCESTINYCSEQQPCPPGVPCLPRLGGYTCQCPPTHMGIHCDIAKRKPIRDMRQADFLFHPEQYTAVSSTYCFYASQLGDLVKVSIDMGDGSQVELNRNNFTTDNNAKDKLQEYFFPPLNIPAGALQVSVFQHAYRAEGTYNVTVRATNLRYDVFSAVYGVRVQRVDRCRLSTRLVHCSRNASTPMRFRRRSHVVILSATRIDCTHSKLRFSWTMYKVASFEDEAASPENLHDLNGQVDLQGPHLRILPYTLPFGRYVVTHRVQMLSPGLGLAADATAFLEVVRAPLVVLLRGGSLINAHWDKDLILDASESHDPNEAPGRRAQLSFQWSCSCSKSPSLSWRPQGCSDPHCRGLGVPLGQAGARLLVPARALRRRGEYTFMVNVSSERADGVDTAWRKQRVAVVPARTPLLRIHCLRNCPGQYSNPDEVTSLEATCESCASIQDLSDFSWNIYSKYLHAAVNISATEFGLEFPQLIIYEGSFKSGVVYSVIFNGIKNDPRHKNEFIQSEWIGKAEQVLSFNQPPEPGNCFVTPQQGYGMLTNFSVHCRKFTDKDRPLMYEVAHFCNLDDLDTTGVIVGYDTGPDIEDLTLAPGLEEFRYVTTLRIFITDALGLYTSYEYNVTVLPAISYLDEPEEVLYRLEHVGSGDESPLGMMMAAGNTPALVQLALSTAMTLQDFVESGDARRVDATRLHGAMSSVRESLVDYLAKVPVYTTTMLKHTCTALDIVIKSGTINEVVLSGTDSTAAKRAGRMLSRIVTTLDEHNRYNILISKMDMQDIGICVLSLMSSLFGNPLSFHSKEATAEADPQFLEELNLGHVAQERLYRNFTSQILKDLREFSRHYLQYKVKQERTSLMNGPGVTLMLKKASPQYLNKDSLTIDGLAGVNFVFPQAWIDEERTLHAHVLMVDSNPFWWHPASHAINFPLVQFDLTDEQGAKVEVPMNVELRPPEDMKPERVRGALEIHPYWTLNDYDIQVHRVQVPHGGKLLIQFMSIKDDMQLQVVVKKDVRPELHDFWTDAVTIPQTSPVTNSDTSYSLYVDDAAAAEGSLFYIGLLPHVDTLHAVFETPHNVPLVPPVPQHFQYEDENDPDYQGMESQLSYRRDTSNVTLPYELAVFSARCLTWDDKEVAWGPGCEVSPSTTPKKVKCRCQGVSTLAVAFNSVPQDLHMYSGVRFFITFMDNPLIIFLLMQLGVIFLGLFAWASFTDREDQLRRDIIFLADNNPAHTYCYLLLVQTGRRARAGTTSRVALQLEGEAGSSAVHVLGTHRRPVLTRGAQDWFVLKTASTLGELMWLHLWHNHSGAGPDWYCSRVVVHDIHTHHVWFFVVEQWLSPLHGDGTMSCSVFRSLQNEVFGGRFRFHDHLVKQFDRGQHGWFSIFHRHPYSSFTRRQRVGVALAHAAMLLLGTVQVFEWPTHDEATAQLSGSGGSYDWSTRELVSGVYTALVVFPIHLVLATLFRCVSPLPDWSRAPSYYTDTRPGRSMDMRKKLSNASSTVPGSMLPVEPNPLERLARYFGWTKLPAQRPIVLDHDLLSANRAFATIPIKRRVVPLRRSASQPQWNKLDVLPTRPPVDRPLVGRRVVDEWFCLPPYFLYVLWLLVAAILVPCVYVTALNGVSYGWAVSMRFVLSFACGLLASMLLLETGKLLLFTLIYTCASSRHIKVEDRSDLVRYLDGDLTLDREQVALRQVEVQRRRQDRAYRPLPRRKVELLQRNAVLEATSKGIISDLGIYLLFGIILTCIMSGIGDKLGYYSVRAVLGLVGGRAAFGRTALGDITHQDGLVSYLNSTLIPAIHGEPGDGGRTQDPAYYLVGVPRLRQQTEGNFATGPRASRGLPRGAAPGVAVPGRPLRHGGLRGGLGAERQGRREAAHRAPRRAGLAPREQLATGGGACPRGRVILPRWRLRGAAGPHPGHVAHRPAVPGAERLAGPAEPRRASGAGALLPRPQPGSRRGAAGGARRHRGRLGAPHRRPAQGAAPLVRRRAVRAGDVRRAHHLAGALHHARERQDRSHAARPLLHLLLAPAGLRAGRAGRHRVRPVPVPHSGPELVARQAGAPRARRVHQLLLRHALGYHPTGRVRHHAVPGAAQDVACAVRQVPLPTDDGRHARRSQPSPALRGAVRTSAGRLRRRGLLAVPVRVAQVSQRRHVGSGYRRLRAGQLPAPICSGHAPRHNPRNSARWVRLLPRLLRGRHPGVALDVRRHPHLQIPGGASVG